MRIKVYLDFTEQVSKEQMAEFVREVITLGGNVLCTECKRDYDECVCKKQNKEELDV